jgi:exopolysaccharide biosynthesis operon protein EpsL
MSNSKRNVPGADSSPAGASAPAFGRAAAHVRSGPARLLRLPLAVLLGTLGAMPASAAPSDPLHLYAGLSYFHDDNLFRLPDEVPGFDNRRSDSARQTTVGVYFDKQYSRQKVFLQAKRSKVDFDHFKQLDYDGKDYLARLNWEVGNHFSGSAGASYNQTLAPYTDFRSRERNLREQRREFFDGAWRFHPSWRARVAANRDRYEYELPIQRLNNRKETWTEAGVDFLPRSGSTAGLQVRRLKGNYENPRIYGNFVLDDSFTQDELKARVDWRATPISTVSVLAGQVRRKYEGPNARSVSGFNGRVTVSSQTRAKLRLTGALYREFLPVESNIVSYALSRGASAAAIWDATTKIRVDASATAERREYEAGRIPVADDALKDKLRRVSLNATWTPRPTIQVTAGAARERRSGSVFFGNANYTANTVTFGANAQF